MNGFIFTGTPAALPELAPSNQWPGPQGNCLWRTWAWALYRPKYPGACRLPDPVPRARCRDPFPATSQFSAAENPSDLRGVASPVRRIQTFAWSLQGARRDPTPAPAHEHRGLQCALCSVGGVGTRGDSPGCGMTFESLVLSRRVWFLELKSLRQTAWKRLLSVSLVSPRGLWGVFSTPMR